MDSLTIADHLYVVGLCAVFLYAVLKTQPKLADNQFSTAEKISMYWSQTIFLFAIGILGVVIWYLDGHELSALGLCWPQPGYFWYWVGFTVFFLFCYLIDLAKTVMIPRHLEEARTRWKRKTPFMPVNRTEMKHAVPMAFAAGIGEEIVFRGFFIHYVTRLVDGQALAGAALPFQTTGIAVAIVAPGVIFGLAHLYSGWKMVFKIIFLAVLFGCIYVTSGSLLIVVILHILIDIIAIRLGPIMQSGGTGVELDTADGDG